MKITEEHKEKLRKYRGELASNWKGGLPKCPDCGKEIRYDSNNCNKCKVFYRTTDHQNKLNIAISNALTGKMPANLGHEGKFANVKRGWFDINGKRMFFRSTWEANYARYLDWLKKQKHILDWEYETDVFIFHKIQFGTRSYRPDFKVRMISGEVEYHEIKGWMDSKSKTKLKRMAKYYPEIKLILVDKVGYNDIKKKLGRIVGFC